MRCTLSTTLQLRLSTPASTAPQEVSTELKVTSVQGLLDAVERLGTAATFNDVRTIVAQGNTKFAATILNDVRCADGPTVWESIVRARLCAAVPSRVKTLLQPYTCRTRRLTWLLSCFPVRIVPRSPSV